MKHRTSSRVLLIVAAFVLFLVPVAAIAAGGFDDVPDDNVFEADIHWLADAGVTKGCNPPANTEFCPGSTVTREQMSAFMHRLAVNKVVDAATAVEAVNADTLDGRDSSEFMKVSDYDADGDLVVDQGEVKIRHKSQVFNLDIFAAVAQWKCVTDPVTVNATTTVVISGGLSLVPNETSTEPIYADVGYSIDGGDFTGGFSNARIKATPTEGTGSAAVPIDAVATLGPGTYRFAIYPQGDWDILTSPEYSGRCELTVTAYVGP